MEGQRDFFTIPEMVIYRIFNRISGKFYIGSSEHFTERRQCHLSILRGGRHFNAHLQSAYDLYGEKAFEFQIVEYVDNSDSLLAREQYWLDNTNPDLLYNMATIAGRPANSGQWWKGKKHTEAARKKQSLAKKGRKPTPFQMLRSIETSKKPVKQIDLTTGEVLAIFPCAMDAARAIGQTSCSNIQATCRGVRNRAGGYRWQFARDTDPPPIPSFNDNRKAVEQIDPVSGEVIAVFASQTEAARAIGKKSTSIYRVCRGFKKSAGGYLWRYVTQAALS